jgi:UDP-2,3-diacylglucosamine pyrophosphatase LpxH
VRYSSTNSDLWREGEPAADKVNATVNRILKDNPEARTHLVRTSADSLQADLVRGNHDWYMSKSTQLNRAKAAHVYAVDGKKTILATHGHVFDWIEDFPDEFQGAIVERFGVKATPGKPELDRRLLREKEMFIDEEETFWGIAEEEDTGAQGDPPRILTREEESDDLPRQVNVWVAKGTFNLGNIRKGHRLMPRALTYARELRKGTKLFRKKLNMSGKAPNLRTIVIGHSHHARICIYSERGAPDKRLVLADCGAWIEYARLRNTIVPSCQIGVLCGGDMRIYQLDPHKRLYH